MKPVLIIVQMPADSNIRELAPDGSTLFNINTRSRWTPEQMEFANSVECVFVSSGELGLGWK